MNPTGLASSLIRLPLRVAQFAFDAARSAIESRTSREPSSPSPPPSSSTPEPEPLVEEEEEVLVAEVTEPGFTEPAGAQIHVDEPFSGYDSLSAADVISHLDGASAEEAAAVELYEGTTKGRQTVLRAADRRLVEVRGV